MPYDRDAAVAYAEKWAYGRNPAFYDFSDLGGDCTNFASQCLYAGSKIMNYTPVYGWYYINLQRRSPSWTGVNELYRFLVNNQGPGPRAIVTGLNRIEKGDIIQLRLRSADKFDHSPVVTDAGDGTPDTIIVAAHSIDSRCRPLSSYRYLELRPLHIIGVGE